MEYQSSYNYATEKIECFYYLDTSVGVYRLAGIVMDLQVFDPGHFPEQDHLHALCTAFLPK